MEITCAQMDVLIPFYLENDLTPILQKKVEEHMLKCPTCRAKYNILRSIFKEFGDTVNEDKEKTLATQAQMTKTYKTFQDNLSAYVDNELPQEESIKMKKFTINNKKARKELQDTYNIRKLMSESFKKTKSESKSDFSKSVLKELDLLEKDAQNFNPLLKVAIAFILTVLILSTLIIISLSL